MALFVDAPAQVPASTGDPLATIIIVLVAAIGLMIVAQIGLGVLMYRRDRAFSRLAEAASTLMENVDQARYADSVMTPAIESPVVPASNPPIDVPMSADESEFEYEFFDDEPAVSKRTTLRPPPLAPKSRVIDMTPLLVPLPDDVTELGFDPDAEYGALPIAAEPVSIHQSASRVKELVRTPTPRRSTRFASIEELAVSAVIDDGRAVAQVAQTLRVSSALVSYWVNKSSRTGTR